MRVQDAEAAGPDAPAVVRQLSTADHMVVSVLWLALNAQWLTVVPIVVPDQVAAIVGPDDASKAGIVGSVTAAGAFVALVVSPIAGALSDRLRAPRGRRRPFLIYGVIATCIALVPLAMFGSASSLALYVLAILNLQFWWNWTAGAYAGLIPDIVPPEAQSRASGWLNVMTIVGTVLGNVLIWALYRPDRAGPLIGAFIALNLGCLALMQA
jgi:MFS family permease